MRIEAHGKICKLVEAVDQITFSGAEALKARQTVLYVTERAVFALREDGVHLLELAPGIDLQRDVLDRMAFAPRMDTPPKVMDAALFMDHNVETGMGGN